MSSSTSGCCWVHWAAVSLNPDPGGHVSNGVQHPPATSLSVSDLLWERGTIKSKISFSAFQEGEKGGHQNTWCSADVRNADVEDFGRHFKDIWINKTTDKDLIVVQEVIKFSIAKGIWRSEVSLDCMGMTQSLNDHGPIYEFVQFTTSSQLLLLTFCLVTGTAFVAAWVKNNESGFNILFLFCL